MASHVRSNADQATLAYELMLGTILGELGFGDAGVARAWARFWLCDPEDAAASAGAARDLAAAVNAAELPLSTVAQVHSRLMGLEIRHLAADLAKDAATIAAWLESASARLVLLMACVEGERVSVAPAAAGQPADHALAAIAEAAGILNRSLADLRAAAPAPARAGRRRAA